MYGTLSTDSKTQNNSTLQSTTMTSKRKKSPLEKTEYTPPRKNNSTFQLPRVKEFHIGSSPDETVAAPISNKNKTKDKREGTLKPYIEPGRGGSGGITRGDGGGKNPGRRRGGRGRGGISLNDESFNYSSSTVSSKGRGGRGRGGATDNEEGGNYNKNTAGGGRGRGNCERGISADGTVRLQQAGNNYGILRPCSNQRSMQQAIPSTRRALKN
jgi:hypothetical protein